MNKENLEIVSLFSMQKNVGVGTSLVEKIILTAKNSNCKKVWLITTNDNINAIRFYQKRGFALVKFYRYSVLKSRKIKPQIPLVGNYDIPILHEIEFEMLV